MIYRHIIPQLKNDFQKGKTIVLYGPRQVGKTTLLKILQKKLPQSQYLDCDFLSHREILSQHEYSILKKMIGSTLYLFIDEAQQVKNIGLTLKILHDNFPDLQVIASGSSSFLLANEISETLTGRTIEYKLYPIAYTEIIPNYTYLERKQLLEELLIFGMYPDILNQPYLKKEETLHYLTSNLLYKDILEFEYIRKSHILSDLLKLLALQIGQLVSFHEIAQKLGVSTNTIEKYIFLLEESFIIKRFTSFSRNPRNEIRKSSKIYFCDVGVRNALIQNFQSLSFRSDVGALWENFCIMERMKYLEYHKKFTQSYFWRTYDQAEVDYVETQGDNIFAFECKWNGTQNISRSFTTLYPHSKSFCIHPENFEDLLFSDH